ncbi:MAG: glycine cleavage system protein H [Pirellulaceae bacterium]|nr:glycine cleavage system protein H [Pirellulaceae bacterium]
MSDSLVFMMGQYAATIPTDRQYARNHMWAQRRGHVYRFGFSAYAVRLLQDVYFLDWTIDANSRLETRQEIGSIESKKAEASLYAPIAGRLTEFNPELLDDPSAINVDTYSVGWLFEVEGDGEGLLSAGEYVEYLDEVWVATQRTIKGQLS